MATEHPLDKWWRESSLILTHDEQDKALASLAWNRALAAAAAVCEQKVVREAGHGGQWEGYGSSQGDKTGPECAGAIKELRHGEPR